jgi:hypothetical protein
MAIEIELKAWVDDREAVEKRIEALAVFMADFEKDDVYWLPYPDGGQPLAAVRVRQECVMSRDAPAGRLALVTYKAKEVRRGVEVNDEKEFAVAAVPSAASAADGTAADGAALAAFEELLDRLGFAPGMSKKNGGAHGSTKPPESRLNFPMWSVSAVFWNWKFLPRTTATRQ